MSDARAAPDLPDADHLTDVETGRRHPTGRVAAAVAIGIAAGWSLFQLWYVSPLPFLTGFLLVNDAEARALHLGFALLLAFISFPALRSSPTDRVPWYDWGLAAIGFFCATYGYWFYDQLAMRPGAPSGLDILIAATGLIILFEATRRALGWPLFIVAGCALAYVFFGDAGWLPDLMRHGGASLNRAMSHLWLTTEGVFGIAIGVSVKFVFLFVLFGAMLEKAGAGSYFIRTTFAMMGHLRGGPAKAAVAASAMTGVISGSSIANTVTTGTFTIPLMKRVGFSGEKAGAVEVASSVNGQLMPPVMGAAAFLMAEYVGIPYLQVIQHAVLPAVISYIALIYIVHLEALKAGMEGLPKPHASPLWIGMVRGGLTLSAIIILSFVTYYAIAWIKPVFGEAAIWVIGGAILAAYIGMLRIAARADHPPYEAPDDLGEHLPELGPTVRSGLYFLLPLVVLIWCLMVERLSPALSAFYAICLMAAIQISQRPLMVLLKPGHKPGQAGPEFRTGLIELWDALIAGARNMTGIAIATATAGIIVGTVTLTGVGLAMAGLVEYLSGGNLLIMLLLVAVLSLILGMGLPTTANYIVVSSLLAPVIVTVGAENGLIVPLIAVHLFVFYFGIMADVTPPVGLASFAAAAVSRGDPLKTGLQAFHYSLRTVVLPFMFIFNPELILFGIESGLQLALTIIGATAAILVFSAASQGFFITRSRWYETAALLAVAFTLFRPDFFMNQLYPPRAELAPTEVAEIAAGIPDAGSISLRIEGMNFAGEMENRVVLLPLGPQGADGLSRLADEAGLILEPNEQGELIVFNAAFGSEAQKAGIVFDQKVTGVLIENDVPPAELFWIPALGLLALVWWGQGRRRAG